MPRKLLCSTHNHGGVNYAPVSTDTQPRRPLRALFSTGIAEMLAAGINGQPAPSTPTLHRGIIVCFTNFTHPKQATNRQLKSTPISLQWGLMSSCMHLLRSPEKQMASFKLGNILTNCSRSRFSRLLNNCQFRVANHFMCVWRASICGRIT